MNPEQLGPRIAYLRKQYQMSQRELAERADITHSAISAMENSKVSPSVSSLHKLVQVFGLSLAEFFTLDEPDRPTQVVLKPEQLIELGNEAVSMKLVCDGRPNRQLGFLLERFEPNTCTGTERIRHEGEEAGTVLEGEIELTLGDQTHLIRAGESYLLDTSIPHKFTNRSNRVCRLVSAHSPANF
ncbi:HTH-type transcriptional regulator PuuR [Ferrimonas marina]|uniref:Transcriptional regulator, XRE family with cupin sensor n=1 Tax=Ferrimonas marina TaxID=299255 RepID=A0A1M5YSY6_9GAMM|nr:HTH-type transcriptional regulator PuuR [Ferrimonas marina]SHI14663.1 transcriptional regulator, XRE family with cupin sensor [Ferrimonas marina]